MRHSAPLRLLLALCVVVVALTGLPAAAGAQSAPDAPPAAPAAAPADQGTPTNGGGGGIDLMALLRPILDDLVDFVFQHVVVNLLRGLAEGLHRIVGAVMGSAMNFVTQTPAGVSYDNPTVANLAGRMRAVANAALFVIAAWGGINVILRRHLGEPYHAVMELVPRLVVGALLVNTSGWWTRLLVDANNALCQAVGGTSLPVWDRVDTSSSILLDLAATLIYLVAALAFTVQMLMRLALVDALLVVAPLGLACWVLPQTQGWARLWSSTFTASVLVQFLQVLTLSLGGGLLAQAAPVGLDSAAVTPFLGLAALLLTMKVPGLVYVRFINTFGGVMPTAAVDAAASGAKAAAGGAGKGGR